MAELCEGINSATAQRDVRVGVVDKGHDVTKGRVGRGVAQGVDVQRLPVQMVVQFLLRHH